MSKVEGLSLGPDDDKVMTDVSDKAKVAPTLSAAAAATTAASTTTTAGAVSSVRAPMALDDGKDAGGPLKITSKDQKEFVIERKYACHSVLVKTALENDDKADMVPIPGVTGPILDLVVKWLNEHKGVDPPAIEKPLRSKNMADVCQYKWDAEFIDKIGDVRKELYDLVLAANYMDIKPLLHLGCAKIASLIKGQPLEKIKEILDINYRKDAAPNANAAAAGAAATGADQKTMPTAAAAAAPAAGPGPAPNNQSSSSSSSSSSAPSASSRPAAPKDNSTDRKR
jgi:S-phase kinase-associated protein 1